MGKRIKRVSVVDPAAVNSVEELHYINVKTFQEQKKSEKGNFSSQLVYFDTRDMSP